MMKVLGYTRVSTREQADEGFSLGTQRAAIEAECEQRGWELIDVIEDAGFTGRNDDRPGLQRAKAMLAKRNGPKVIVVFRLDRLSRSVGRLADLFDLSAKQRWGIVAMDRDIDTTSAGGRMIANMLGVVAQHESEIIGERVAVGMKAAYAKAKAENVTPRFGFQRRVDDATVARIIRARNKGQPFNVIAKRLDSTKTPTPNGGKRWYPSTVARIYERATAVTS